VANRREGGVTRECRRCDMLRTRKRRNDGTASISNDSEISASVSASI